jgi:hypothetical protein
MEFVSSSHTNSFTAKCWFTWSLSFTRASQGDSVIRPRIPIVACVSAACSLLPKTVVIKLQNAGMFKNSTPENPTRDCIKASDCIEWLQQQVFFFVFVEMQNVRVPNCILYFFCRHPIVFFGIANTCERAI